MKSLVTFMLTLAAIFLAGFSKKSYELSLENPISILPKDRYRKVTILSFEKHIVGWAKKTLSNIDPALKEKLKEDKAKIVVTKVEVDKKRFGILMAIYDEEKHEIIEESMEFIQYKELDEETQLAFRDKDMLVLR